MHVISQSFLVLHVSSSQPSHVSFSLIHSPALHFISQAQLFTFKSSQGLTLNPKPISRYITHSFTASPARFTSLAITSFAHITCKHLSSSVHVYLYPRPALTPSAHSQPSCLKTLQIAITSQPHMISNLTGLTKSGPSFLFILACNHTDWA